MPTRDHAPFGSPCWADLWTSDVPGSRAFYSELFGWEAQEPSPEFGGYFMFTRDGVPVAGGMGDMGDMAANDTWKIYLDTDDIAGVADRAAAAEAQVPVPPSPVADLGTQMVIVDPGGAAVGAWQAGTFPGFAVLGEHGTPSWFELHTGRYQEAVGFYRSVFGWETDTMSDTADFRYTTVKNPEGGEEMAGILDAATFLPEGAPARWYVYWEVDDVDQVVSRVKALGGAVLLDPQDTPYGRMATVADPAGAELKLRTGPR